MPQQLFLCPAVQEFNPKLCFSINQVFPKENKSFINMGLLQLAPKCFIWPFCPCFWFLFVLSCVFFSTCKRIKNIPEWNITNSPVYSLTKLRCKLREKPNECTQRGSDKAAPSLPFLIWNVSKHKSGEETPNCIFTALSFKLPVSFFSSHFHRLFHRFRISWTPSWLK